MPTLALPVVDIKIGTGSDQEAHFLAIILARQTTPEEIQAICEIMYTHFRDNDGPFMNREFVRNEIHLWPTGKSKEHFKTSKSAYAEYSEILKILGLDYWVNELPIDGDLCLSNERSPSSQLKPQKQDDIGGTGFFTCIVPQ